MRTRRVSWTYLAGAVLLLAMVGLAIHNMETIVAAFSLMHQAVIRWLMLAVLAIGSGFLCAGRIYGRILATLGYRVHQFWLSAAALVSILISQTIPAGSVGSYAFLTASLRRRDIAGTSVALVASLELLSWIGAMLLLFCYGLIYLLVTTEYGIATLQTFPAAAFALMVLSSGFFVGSRPHTTLRDWVLRVKNVIERVSGPLCTDACVLQVVDEMVANRQTLMKQPGQVVLLVFLQLTVFLLHALALLAVLYSLGVSVAPYAVLAAYGLALIASTFTVLPGGGGTVEAALTLALSVQGVPLESALGAAILFRLLSFWLLLPLGAVCYRLLTTSNNPDITHDERRATGGE